MSSQNSVRSTLKQMYAHVLQFVKENPDSVAVTVTRTAGGLPILSLRLGDSFGINVLERVIKDEIEWLNLTAIPDDKIVDALLKRQGAAGPIIFGLVDKAIQDRTDLAKVAADYADLIKSQLSSEEYMEDVRAVFPVKKTPSTKRRGGWRDRLIAWCMRQVNRYPD